MTNIAKPKFKIALTNIVAANSHDECTISPANPSSLLRSFSSASTRFMPMVQKLLLNPEHID
ncbi:MAG: hypothetical protein AAF585_14940, partial [Verrucomicrobiota bacterium]